MFHPLCGDAFEGLKRDIQKSGLIPPIEITPHNVIIDGHQRLRAVTELGWEEVDVWVRGDLTGDQIELRHLDANRNRRQLDTLDQLRLARRTFELNEGCEPGGLSDWQYAKMKKTVAKTIGKSPRHTQRLLNVVDAPMDVQKAFSDGKLKVELAEKVHRLNKDLQAEIAAKIRAGGNPNGIVLEHLQKPATKPADPWEVLGRVVDALDVGMEVLGGREGEIRSSDADLERHIGVFERSQPFVEELLSTRKAQQDNQAKLKKAVQDLVNDRPRKPGRRRRK